MMSRRTRFALAVLASSACAGDADTPRVSTRDSAGIRIVASRAPAWTDALAWRVDSSPRVSIGVVDGAPEYLLHRIGGALRLPDGRIVVGDGGSGQLRFYDSTGTFLQAAGRKGHGPGEFGESVMRVWRGARGEIFVSDNDNARINVVSDAGWFVRVVQLHGLQGSPFTSALGAFEDGSILGMVNPSRSDSIVGRDARLQYPELLYLQFDENGRVVSHLRKARGGPQLVYGHEGTTRRQLLPFAPAALLTTLGEATAFSTGSSHEVAIRLPDELRDEAVFRWAGAPRRRVADVWDRYTQSSVEGLEPSTRTSREHFHSLDLPLPEYVPAIERLMADDAGNLWARRYRLPWESAQAWDVLAPGGEWLGTVVTPSGLGVMQIGSDFVLGTHEDRDGIERVRLHRLHKPVEQRRGAAH